MDEPGGGASEALSRMLGAFLPHLAEEALFFSGFLCFQAVPWGGVGGEGMPKDYTDLAPLHVDGREMQAGEGEEEEMLSLERALEELMRGMQVNLNLKYGLEAQVVTQTGTEMGGVEGRWGGGASAVQGWGGWRGGGIGEGNKKNPILWESKHTHIVFAAWEGTRKTEKPKT